MRLFHPFLLHPLQPGAMRSDGTLGLKKQLITSTKFPQWVLAVLACVLLSACRESKEDPTPRMTFSEESFSHFDPEPDPAREKLSRDLAEKQRSLRDFEWRYLRGFSPDAWKLQEHFRVQKELLAIGHNLFTPLGLPPNGVETVGVDSNGGPRKSREALEAYKRRLEDPASVPDFPAQYRRYQETYGEIKSELVSLSNKVAELDKKKAPEKLRRAQIAFHSPERMEIETTQEVELLVSLKESEDDLRRKILETKSPPVSTGTIEIGQFVRAELKGADFEVTETLGGDQRLDESQTLEWKWAVKPLAAGEGKSLYLTIFYLVSSEGIQGVSRVMAFEQEIVVNVSWGYRMANLWNADWFQGLVSAIAFAALSVCSVRIFKRIKRGGERERN